MARRHYNLPDFLRAAPNEMLAEYFQRLGLLNQVDFTKLKPRKMEPIFDAITNLSEDKRAILDTNFQDIFALSYEAGVKLLIDEGQYNGIDLISSFDSLKGNFAKAFRTFLDHPETFDTALKLSCRDNLTGYWRKRRGLPTLTNADFTTRRNTLADAIGNFFKAEGRGRACIVDYVQRGQLHFFFAYPEDYSQSYLHYEDGTLKRGNHNPAFEVIYIYNAEQGALDVFFDGSADTVRQLQEIFAKTGLELTQPAPNAQPAYELDSLKHPGFRFKLKPEWGISSVVVTQLGVSRWIESKSRQVIIKCGNNAAQSEIYEELDLLFPYQPRDGRASRSSVNPFSAQIKAEFAPNGRKRRQTRSFTITLSSCNLTYEKNDLLLRQMIADSGLEGCNDTPANQNTRQPALQSA